MKYIPENKHISSTRSLASLCRAYVSASKQKVQKSRFSVDRGMLANGEKNALDSRAFLMA
jgi:hypothetical protein